MVARILSIVLRAIVPTAMLTGTFAPAVAQSGNCPLPIGQPANADSGDPLVPVYCLPDAPVHAPTRVTGANDWVDDFGVDGMARLNDGDMGYRVFDAQGGIAVSKHLIVGDHWIDDNQLRYNGGAMMRPDRTFDFENGKLIIEGDASAGKQVYGGDQWIEFTVTTAPSPDRYTADAPEQGYAYGRFHGFPTFGCRFQNGGENTCSGFLGNSTANYPANNLPFQPTGDRPPCFSLASDRLWELSYFQSCGSNFDGVHFGGFSDPAHSVWRSCAPTQDYDPCLDRFRIELSKTGMVLYVNGIRYFEDSGWDAQHALPDSLVNAPVYVYYDDWGQGGGPGAVRFHWERLAVNAHGANGQFLPPSASPSFGSQLAPTPTAAPTRTATATPTRTPVPSATATPTPPPSGDVCTVSGFKNGTPTTFPYPCPAT
jgi:hypothetical protein